MGDTGPNRQPARAIPATGHTSNPAREAGGNVNQDVGRVVFMR